MEQGCSRKQRNARWLYHAAPVVVVFMVFLIICLLLWQIMGGSFFGPSVYNSYTL